MKRLLTFITALFLLVSLNGQIMRYGNYIAPPAEGGNDFLTNLVAYWNLDETSGIYNDSDGTNDLTNTGATYGSGSNGILGNAPTFVFSESDALTAAEAADLCMYDQDFTFTAWIYPTSVTRADGDCIVLGGMNSAAGMAVTRTTGYLQIQRNNYAASQSTLAITLNEWNFIAISFNSTATSSNVIFYVNGSSYTGTFNYGFIDGRSTNTIGYRYIVDSQGFDGLIDEVGIWKGRKMTTDELDDLYNGGAGLAYSEFD